MPRLICADPNGNGNPDDALDGDNGGIPNYLDNTVAGLPVPGPLVVTENSNLIGDKRYELTNHLGNVLVVVNDKKLVELDNSNNLSYFRPEVLSFNGYYPFGMLMPGRHGNTTTATASKGRKWITR